MTSAKTNNQISNQPRKFRKRIWIPVVFILVLFGFRLYLPTWLLNHSNQVLNEIPGYQGSIEELDLHLFRGGGKFYNMTLNSTGATTDVPFLKIPSGDISIQWRALFGGRVVSEIYLEQPQITFVFEDHDSVAQKQVELSDWTDALDRLIPIDINHLEILNGKLGLVKLQADPDFDLYVDQFNLIAENLELIKQKEKTLPSSINASGQTIGGGTLKLNAKADLIRNIPDLDLNASIENIDMTALNDVSRHYAKIDFVSGELDLFSEVAISDGFLKGYFKPLLSNAELVDQSDGFFQTLWEGTVNMFKFIFKNHSTDILATRVPLEGDLNQVESSAWQTFMNILSNAFVEAFKGDIDQDINIDDAQTAKDQQ